MKKYISLLLLLGISTVVFAQKPKSTLKFSSPKKLPFIINSDAEELMPVPSYDGKKLFFVRAMHKENKGGRFGGQDIWFASKDANGNWKAPKQSRTFNNIGNNAVVGIDSTGTRVFLLNSYEDESGAISGLSYSDFINGSWTTPVSTEIKDVYNLGEENDIYGLSINTVSDVLLISMKGKNSLGEEDLYVSFKFVGWNRFYNQNNKDRIGNYWWSPPIHLGNVVNSKKYEISPFLSPDGKTLFFASNKPGGFGKADLYYSTRLDDSWVNWSEPVNLGYGINSRHFDAYPYINESDSSFFFASSRSGRFANIYEMKLQESETEILKKDAIRAVDALGNVIADTKKEVTKPTVIVAKKEETVIKNDAKKDPSKFGATAGEIQDDTYVITSQKELNRMNRIHRDILFENGSFAILIIDEDVLKSTLTIMKYNPRLQVKLIGHTDHIGDTAANERLSKKRSRAVKDYLVSKGIAPNRILTEAHGESKLKTESTDSESLQINRRVELEFKMK